MSDEAQNVAILTEAYRRWHDSRGSSVDHWMSICDENIQFGSLIQGSAPGVAYMSEYKARDELGRYFEGLAHDWEMIEYKVDQFVAQGDRVVMLGRCAWHKNSGKVVNTPKVDSWRFANGEAVEYYEYFDTAQVYAAVA